MVVWDDCVAGLLEHRHDPQALVVEWFPGERRIDLPRANDFRLVAPVQAQGLDPSGRQEFLERLDDAGHHQSWHETDCENGRRLEGLLQSAPDSSSLGEQGPAVLEQESSGWSQVGSSATSCEQLGAELGLQRLDLARQDRLRNVKPLSGSSEVEFLGNGDEVSQLA